MGLIIRQLLDLRERQVLARGRVEPMGSSTRWVGRFGDEQPQAWNGPLNCGLILFGGGAHV